MSLVLGYHLFLYFNNIFSFSGKIAPISVSSHAIINLGVHESAACRVLIKENLEKISQAVLSHRNSRNPYIQHALLALLPRLAAFDCAHFVKENLTITMNYLLTTLRGRDADRGSAFVALGFMAVAVGTEICPFLPRVWEVIRGVLPSRDTPSKKRGIPEPTVFACISLVGHAVGWAIGEDAKDLLEPMFATGLTLALTTALRELALCVPQLKKDISNGLLRMLSQVLTKKYFLQIF